LAGQVCFAGGKKEAGHACCSCSPLTSPAPPAPTTRWLGLAWYSP
jgi:hypothetical protein